MDIQATIYQSNRLQLTIVSFKTLTMFFSIFLKAITNRAIRIEDQARKAAKYLILIREIQPKICK